MKGIKTDGQDKVITYDNYTWTINNQNGYYQANVKIDGKVKTVPLHVYIYTQYKGNIVKGYVIHHVDGDKFNNTAENLVMITRAKHIRIHKEGKTGQKYEKQTGKILNVELNKTYNTVKEAAEDTDITKANSLQATISYCLHGKRETAGNYHWTRIPA